MDELYHHGIMGMHWGIRRTPEQLGHKVKKVRKMTDDELKKAVERLRFEKSYKDLADELSGNKNNGNNNNNKRKDKKTEEHFLRDNAKKLVGNALVDFGKKSLDKVVDNVVKKIFDETFDPKKYDHLDLEKASLSDLKEANQYYAQRELYFKNHPNKKATAKALTNAINGIDYDQKLPKLKGKMNPYDPRWLY